MLERRPTAILGRIKEIEKSTQKRVIKVLHLIALHEHKSQGSECDNVDLVLPEAAGNLLSTREILYTAVTRAKKHVRIFTTCKAMEGALRNEIVSKRYCGLLDYLKK